MRLVRQVFPYPVCFSQVFLKPDAQICVSRSCKHLRSGSSEGLASALQKTAASPPFAAKTAQNEQSVMRLVWNWQISLGKVRMKLSSWLHRVLQAAPPAHPKPALNSTPKPKPKPNPNPVHVWISVPLCHWVVVQKTIPGRSNLYF